MSHGKAIQNGSDILCPVYTSSPIAIAEQPEMRAYKLGRQKFSYNQVELVFKFIRGGMNTDMRILEAIEVPLGPEVDEVLRESCIKFNLRLVNSDRMVIYIYLVHCIPYGKTLNNRTSDEPAGPAVYHWTPVTRKQCRKSCKGPVIRGVQRFGRMAKRSGEGNEDSMKEIRYLYISIDEASNHLSDRNETSNLRLLLAAYDRNNQLLGTSVSSSIRVLSNNDAPLGPASFQLHCHIEEMSTASVQRLFLGPPTHDAANRSTAVRQASRWQLNFDLNEEIVCEEELEDGEDNDLNQTRKIRESPEARIHTNDSIFKLCERLIRECMTRRAPVALRTLSTALGTRRKRVSEIMDVFETIRMVQNHGQENYLWLGSSEVSCALLELQGFDLALAIGPTGTRESTNCRSHQYSADEDTRKPFLQTLTKQCLRLFLIHEEESHVSWEQVLDYVIYGPGRKNDPETRNVKTRRLEEIISIFMSVKLIKKVATTESSSHSSQIYEWLGSQGVSDHLVTLATCTGVKNIDGRDGRSCHKRRRSRSPA